MSEDRTVLKWAGYSLYGVVIFYGSEAIYWLYKHLN